MIRSAPELPCILVVDDDEHQLYLTRHLLERAGVKHPIVEARGGPEAIKYLRRCCPHDDGGAVTAVPALMFLDLKMPIADGFAVLDWIRTQDALKAMKVIVLTSSDDPADVKRCTALGARGFLVKHPSPMVIACVLRQALGADAIDAPVASFARSEE